MIVLRRERGERGWSQNRTAAKCGMHPSTISAIESGRQQPWPGQAKALAELFGYPEARAHELFEEVDDARD